MSRDPLRAAAERGVEPDRVVLLAGTAGADGLEPITLEALNEAVERRAGELASAGARAGSVHAFAVEPDRNGVLELLAAWRLGAVPAPLSPKLTDVEREEAEAGLSGRSLEDAQVVLWTSGTSGRPRGVVLGWEAMCAHTDAVAERLDLEPPHDVWLASLSPAHVGGLMLVFRALLTGSRLVAAGALPGGSLVVLMGPDGPGVTHASLVPTQLARLLDRTGNAPPPTSLRCVLLGGAHAPGELLDRALGAGWPVALTYGMTEMASQVATATPEEVRAHPGSPGRPLWGVEVRAASDSELLVRSPGRATGYLDGSPVTDEEGWYHTGDLGRVDREGRLWITGRRADRIVSGGVTVDALEVEEALRAHPAVIDACVAGLPDEEWGETVGACLVIVEGEYDPGELELWVRQRLSDAKRPRRWTVVDALPLNENGKVDRAAARKVILGVR